MRVADSTRLTAARAIWGPMLFETHSWPKPRVWGLGFGARLRV